MNDTPGWASPGSASSDPEQPGAAGQDGTAEVPPQQDGTPPKWSKEQPPPAQWTAPGSGTGGPTPPHSPTAGSGRGGTPPPGGPGTGGPGGGAGWGGQHGPGWGWSAQPPAAKPGVIPLRPLGVGEILDGAVSTMRAYWRTVLGISLAVAVVTEIGALFLQRYALGDSTGTDPLLDPGASNDELMSTVLLNLLGSVLVLLITLLGTVVATALLTSVTSRAVLGRPATVAEAWQEARPQLLRLLGLTLLLPLLTMLLIGVGALPGILMAVAGPHDPGVALAVLGGLATTVVAVWLMIRFSLASPALMLERQTVLKALSRSTKLVRGSWWRVFGIQLLAGLIAYIVAAIIVVPFTVIASVITGDGVGGLLGSGDLNWTFLVLTGIGSVIGTTLTLPISAGVTVLLYIDQRIRREALDLELARAAGLPDPGPTAGR
ncbi:hypothetical protein [Streptomyces sp. NPDC058045]|uniref:DUF7544 domain-containing protein n=1 Tax=Streptomyces sp. NPDC058045 TaxID=3346311 RepID=UPI0036F07634